MFGWAQGSADAFACAKVVIHTCRRCRVCVMPASVANIQAQLDQASTMLAARHITPATADSMARNIEAQLNTMSEIPMPDATALSARIATKGFSQPLVDSLQNTTLQRSMFLLNQASNTPAGNQSLNYPLE